MDHLITTYTRMFPEQFGLRAFPGDVFCIAKGASYVTNDGQVWLYTYRMVGGNWQAFAKGSPEELRRQVVPLPDYPWPRLTSLRTDTGHGLDAWVLHQWRRAGEDRDGTPVTDLLDTLEYAPTRPASPDAEWQDFLDDVVERLIA